MAAVGGLRDEGLPAQGGEVVEAHKPLNPLGIHRLSRPLQLGRDAPVAIVAVFEAEHLDLAGELRVGSQRGLCREASVIAGARQPGQPAQAVDIGVFGVRRRHGFDDGAERGSVVPCGAGPFKARKAF
jgi:hypothetical protein